MKTVLLVLAQPDYLALYIARQLETKPSAASAGLATMVAIAALAALYYVLGSLFSGGSGIKGFLARLNALFARLLISLLIYAAVSVMIYGFINFGSALLSEIDNHPHRKAHTPW